MATFSKTILGDIRDRTSIVGYIGEKVPLKRAGKSFKGRCPFHNEKTPSFHVNDDRGFFHCFGCGESGDIFDFAMKFDGYSFTEAVKLLAMRAGVELPAESVRQAVGEEDAAQKKRAACLRINAIARDYFVERLLHPKAGERARTYLSGRGIFLEKSTQHFLGVADNSWDALANHLANKNVPLALAAELGLLKARENGGYYDFFRDRLMFPIISARGDVVGFSGRDLSGDPNVGKYINSPESVVYGKSASIFGMHQAMAAIRTSDEVILVEGNLDLVALHQAGFENVVAPLGTALTEDQVRLLSRMTRNHTILFDGDAAGRKAMLRSLEIFLALDIPARLALLPEGEDPDSFVRKNGAGALSALLEKRGSLLDWAVETILFECGGDAAGKMQAMKRVVPLLGLIRDNGSLAVARRAVARRMDVDESALQRSVTALQRQGARRAVAGTGTEASAPAFRMETVAVSDPAEVLLGELVVRRPDRAVRVREELDVGLIATGWVRAVLDLLEREPRTDTLALMAVIGEERVAERLHRQLLQEDRLEEGELDATLSDCMARIRNRPVVERLSALLTDIRRAESEQDDDRVLALLKEKKELMHTLNAK